MLLVNKHISHFLFPSPRWGDQTDEELLDREVHPIRIADGFEMAAMISLDHLETIAEYNCIYVHVCECM